MFVKKRELNLISNLIFGIGIIILGIIITVLSIDSYKKVINLLAWVFIIYGLSKLIGTMLNKKIQGNNQALLGFIANTAFGAIILLFPNFSLALLPFLFSIYLLLNGVVKFVNYILLKEVNLKSRFKDLFFAIFFFIFSLGFLFYPIDRLNLFIMIIGIYCILLGINKIYEFIIDILSEKFKLQIKRKFRVSLPALFEAFIPKSALNSINKYIDYLTSEEKNSNDDADLILFIHLSKYGFNQLGHMDVMFDGKIYSYGNYDKSSQKLFTAVGDGVVFVINNKKKYLKFCIENSKKTMVEYGIKLNQNEKNKVQAQLDEIFKYAYKWEPLVVRDKSKKKPKNKYKDYASKLYTNTKAVFYKFKDGEYKNYFVLGHNCSYFVDALLKNCVFERLKSIGIISPGTYYEYLEENYRKKNSKVISKKIYNKENIDDVEVKN